MVKSACVDGVDLDSPPLSGGFWMAWGRQLEAMERKAHLLAKIMEEAVIKMMMMREMENWIVDD